MLISVRFCCFATLLCWPCSAFFFLAILTSSAALDLDLACAARSSYTCLCQIWRCPSSISLLIARRRRVYASSCRGVARWQLLVYVILHLVSWPKSAPCCLSTFCLLAVFVSSTNSSKLCTLCSCCNMVFPIDGHCEAAFAAIKELKLAVWKVLEMGCFQAKFLYQIVYCHRLQNEAVLAASDAELQVNLVF